VSDAALADLDRLTAALRAGAVVDLRAVARLLDLRQRARSPRLGEAALAWAEATLVGIVHDLGGLLLSSVRRVCERNPGLDSPALARLLVRDPDFKRLNRLIRQVRAIFLEVPSCDVRPHQREGRTVRGHFRYLGWEHLAEVPLAGEPDEVAGVLRCLQSGGHRRERIRSVRDPAR
jgi:hypothetical protein